MSDGSSSPDVGQRWVYVVRHCVAEARDTWRDDDLARPLSSKGLRQARAVADHFMTSSERPPLALSSLAGADDEVFIALEPRPVKLVSSPAERCIATLRPLSQATGLAIETDELLSEGSDAALALARLQGLAFAFGSGIVACSHGDVIWSMLALIDRDGVDLPANADAKKGSIWALGVEGARVATARYLPLAKV